MWPPAPAGGGPAPAGGPAQGRPAGVLHQQGVLLCTSPFCVRMRSCPARRGRVSSLESWALSTRTADVPRRSPGYGRAASALSTVRSCPSTLSSKSPSQIGLLGGCEPAQTLFEYQARCPLPSPVAASGSGDLTLLGRPGPKWHARWPRPCPGVKGDGCRGSPSGPVRPWSH